MVKAVKKWSTCMGEAGFDGLGEPEEVDEILQRKLGAIVGLPEEGAEAEYDQEALDELQREEVEMVTADIECEHQYITDVEEEVLAEYEEKFREKNAVLLSKVEGQ
jgi:hypothetical protein